MASIQRWLDALPVQEMHVSQATLAASTGHDNVPGTGADAPILKYLRGLLSWKQQDMQEVRALGLGA